jgi:hypothetical protein
MNSELKRAIYRKKMLYNKFQKYNKSKNWEAYRNLKVHCKFINIYFIERCAGGPKSKDFWPTVKSFLTNKGNVNQKDTVLSENDVLITKLDEVCEIFNNVFVNVAKNIGNSQINVDGDHPSILEIKNNHPELHENSFSFSSINPDFVEKRIRDRQFNLQGGIMVFCFFKNFFFGQHES